MNATTSALVSRTYDRARIAGEASNPDLAAHLRELATTIIDQDADLNSAVLDAHCHRRTADLLTEGLVQSVPLAVSALLLAIEAIGQAREQSPQTREALAKCIVAEEHIRAVALRFPFLTAKLPPS